MVNALLKRFRKYRNTQYFQSPLFKTQKKYAFVGVGMHSLTNLYPVLRHYGVRLAYICTKNSSYEKDMSILFPATKFTNNLQDILSDHEVEGIFISASSDAHFALVTRCLAAGKKVFVEKPPCETTDELKNLIEKNPNSVCKVGLQRRYWPANKTIERKVQKAKTYTYTFHTGAYLDGDILTGLFIHPLDYCLFLFGKADISSIAINKDESGITIQLHLSHANGISGLVECSTHYSWNSPADSLQVNCSAESLNIQYPVLVEGEEKPSRIMNIPSERLLNQTIVNRHYFSAKNFILPVTELNTIFLQGFYSELETFISIVEGTIIRYPKNDLPGLLSLYKLFDEIRAQGNY